MSVDCAVLCRHCRGAAPAGPRAGPPALALSLVRGQCWHWHWARAPGARRSTACPGMMNQSESSNVSESTKKKLTCWHAPSLLQHEIVYPCPHRHGAHPSRPLRARAPPDALRLPAECRCGARGKLTTVQTHCVVGRRGDRRTQGEPDPQELQGRKCARRRRAQELPGLAGLEPDPDQGDDVAGRVRVVGRADAGLHREEGV